MQGICHLGHIQMWSISLFCFPLTKFVLSLEKHACFLLEGWQGHFENGICIPNTSFRSIRLLRLNIFDGTNCFEVLPIRGISLPSIIDHRVFTKTHSIPWSLIIDAARGTCFSMFRGKIKWPNFSALRLVIVKMVGKLIIDEHIGNTSGVKPTKRNYVKLWNNKINLSDFLCKIFSCFILEVIFSGPPEGAQPPESPRLRLAWIQFNWLFVEFINFSS